MFEYIDAYCERLSPAFWAEPINAATNICFIFAAVLAYMYARTKQAASPSVLFLSGLIFIIGIGSFLFHTFANTAAMLADSIPILIYQLGFLYLYSRYVIKLSTIKVASLLGLYFLTSWACAYIFAGILNGSGGYMPALLFITGLGLYHRISNKEEPNILLFAASIFAVSLTCRSLDMTVCESFPIGLHFIWHCLNGKVLYLTTRGYINGLLHYKNAKTAS